MTQRRSGRLVIDVKILPLRAPVLFTVVMLLLLDRLAAPGWAWGLVGGLIGLAWVAFIHDALTRRNVDLLNKGE